MQIFNGVFVDLVETYTLISLLVPRFLHLCLLLFFSLLTMSVREYFTASVPYIHVIFMSLFKFDFILIESVSFQECEIQHIYNQSRRPEKTINVCVLCGHY